MLYINRLTSIFYSLVLSSACVEDTLCHSATPIFSVDKAVVLLPESEDKEGLLKTEYKAKDND